MGVLPQATPVKCYHVTELGLKTRDKDAFVKGHWLETHFST